MQSINNYESNLLVLKISTVILLLSAPFSYAQDNPHSRVPFDCEVCHNTAEWSQVSFDHDRTRFQLEGRHFNASCTDCHNITDFSEINMECSSCHTDVHQNRLTRECGNCHSPSGWQVIDPVTVHANTSFKLIGAHSKIDCKSCHRGEVEGEFLRLSSDCQNCHLNEFHQTRNPDHAGLGFSHRCEECHSPFTWQPADFVDHETRFPIFSGTHRGEWNSCTDCHFNSGNYQDFSCTRNCHEQSRTDRHHDEVGGYSYGDRTCYTCHQNGREED